MMLIEASWPSNRLAAVTTRTGCTGWWRSCDGCPQSMSSTLYDCSGISATRRVPSPPWRIPEADDRSTRSPRPAGNWTERDLAEPLAMAAATSVMRAQQIVATAVDRALSPHDLTFARYEVLMLLSFTSSGSLPITKVGERLMVHPTGITKLVDKLEQQGLVQRIANPDRPARHPRRDHRRGPGARAGGHRGRDRACGSAPTSPTTTSSRSSPWCGSWRSTAGDLSLG